MKVDFKTEILMMTRCDLELIKERIERVSTMIEDLADHKNEPSLTTDEHIHNMIWLNIGALVVMNKKDQAIALIMSSLECDCSHAECYLANMINRSKQEGYTDLPAFIPS